MRLVRPLLCALAAITVAGCASGPDAGTAVSSTPVASPGAFKVCMVADEAGFSDGGINQLAYTGMMAAATDLKLLVGQAQADAQTDYAASIASLAAAQCTLIITVGQQHAGDAQAAAQANSGVKFLLVDAQPAEPRANLKPLLFDLADAAFLAGYVAAAQTQTGTVAEPTGADEPYRNGFAAGVDYFNQAKGAAVAVVPDAAAGTDGVRKVVDAAVISAIGEAARGQFTSSPYYGTLKDGGVDIAPLDASAGDELKAEVEAVRAALINGSVTPPAAG